MTIMSKKRVHHNANRFLNLNVFGKIIFFVIQAGQVLVKKVSLFKTKELTAAKVVKSVLVDRTSLRGLDSITKQISELLNFLFHKMLVCVEF